LNRIDRISAILIHLQSKKIVTAEEIAERFEISKRTVYRDLKALEEAGIPIGAEAGKGYYLVEGYHLPPVMLTREEAGAFIVGAKLIEKHSDFSINEHFQSGLYKIKSVLEGADKEYLERLEGHIDVLKVTGSRKKDFPNHFFADIMKAIAESRAIEIQYFAASKEEWTTRLVHPINLWHYSMGWHLIGFCKLRNDYRDFRLDRMKSISITNQKFKKPKDTSVHTYFKKMAETQELYPATVLVDKSIYAEIQNTRYYFGYLEEKELGDKFQMEFLVNDLNYLAKWLITLDKRIEIIQPPALIQKVNQLVKILWEYYQHK
jgi:predicted DNA-binding transcriptional regulator YafY